MAQWARNTTRSRAAEVPADLIAMTETKKYTSRHTGDACELLVAAELTLAGVPALKVPDLWPGYDVIAQPVGTDTQRSRGPTLFR